MDYSLTSAHEEAVAAYNTHGTLTKAAAALGVSRQVLRYRIDHANARRFKAAPGFKVTKIGTVLGEDGTVRQTSITTKLAPQTDLDERTGQIVRRSTLYGADGAVTNEWIIRKPEDEKDAWVEALRKSFITSVKPIGKPTIVPEVMDQDKLTLFLSVDEHIGVKCLLEKVGYNYGLAEAETLLRTSFDKLLSRTPVTGRAVLVNLGDTFHANDHKGVTPGHGHVLDVDGTTMNSADIAVRLYRYKLERLLERYGEVEYHSVVGNHDLDPQAWLTTCLKLKYETETRLKVQHHESESYAFDFGVNFFGFNHGFRAKPVPLVGMFMDRYAPLYGRTTHRQIHTGHVHHDQEIDLWAGVKFFSHRTLAPQDWYAYSNAYTSRQSCCSFTYDYYEGCIGKAIVNPIAGAK